MLLTIFAGSSPVPWWRFFLPWMNWNPNKSSALVGLGSNHRLTPRETLSRIANISLKPKLGRAQYYKTQIQRSGRVGVRYFLKMPKPNLIGGLLGIVLLQLAYLYE